MTRIVENPGHIKKAEIVVGIPSCNEADSIGFVLSKGDINPFFKILCSRLNSLSG